MGRSSAGLVPTRLEVVGSARERAHIGKNIDKLCRYRRDRSIDPSSPNQAGRTGRPRVAYPAARPAALRSESRERPRRPLRKCAPHPSPSSAAPVAAPSDQVAAGWHSSRRPPPPPGAVRPSRLTYPARSRPTPRAACRQEGDYYGTSPGSALSSALAATSVAGRRSGPAPRASQLRGRTGPGGGRPSRRAARTVRDERGRRGE